MALTVTFTGRTDLPTPVPSAAYKIWSYRIQATGAGELPVGRRIALGLPGDVEVLSPSLYPNVPQLAGTFVERDLSLTRQYVGRVIAATGPQTVSFVAYESETTVRCFWSGPSLVSRGRHCPIRSVRLAAPPTMCRS